MSKEFIKSTLNSKGWQFIEKMLLEEVNEVKRVKTEGKNYQDIAVETIANDKISKAIKSLLNRLNRIKSETNESKVVYK